LADVQFLVRPLDGQASTHRTVAGCARAVLDCGGVAEPVEVVIDFFRRREMTGSELRRLGQAIAAERRKRLEPTDEGVARLVSALTSA
jgi:hypothetical protein